MVPVLLDMEHVQLESMGRILPRLSPENKLPMEEEEEDMMFLCVSPGVGSKLGKHVMWWWPMSFTKKHQSIYP